MNKKNLIIFAAVLVVVAVGVYYFSFRMGYKAAQKAQEDLTKKVTTGTEINPLENLPSANPFENIKTNPFEGLYKNPFK